MNVSSTMLPNRISITQRSTPKRRVRTAVCSSHHQPPRAPTRHLASTPGQGVRPSIEGAPTANKWLSLYRIATVYLILTSFWVGSAAIFHARLLFDEVL